jgi:hypothetical protein
MHRQFQRKGYALLHDWLKEGNISTLGIVKPVSNASASAPNAVVDPEGDGAIEADPIPGTKTGCCTARLLQERRPSSAITSCRWKSSGSRPTPAIPTMRCISPTPRRCTLSELVEMGFDDVDDLQRPRPARYAVDAARDDGFDLLIDRTGRQPPRDAA